MIKDIYNLYRLGLFETWYFCEEIQLQKHLNHVFEYRIAGSPRIRISNC